jgi:hypothetical protein
MSTYAYCYLAGALLNLGLWALLFGLRRDVRREMCVMSCVAVVIGLPHEYWLWTRDWWHPPNLTHTRVGFEDVLYAIGTAGALSSIYPVVTRRRLLPGAAPGRLMAVMPLVIHFALPFLLVFVVGTHSFVACALATCAALLWILPSRPDLIGPSVINAGLGLLISFSCFWLIEWLAPGFVAAIWDLPKLSGVLVAGVPIEDLGWYAYTAALFGVYYKYATGTRFAASTSAASARDRELRVGATE